MHRNSTCSITFVNDLHQRLQTKELLQENSAKELRKQCAIELSSSRDTHLLLHESESNRFVILKISQCSTRIRNWLQGNLPDIHLKTNSQSVRLNPTKRKLLIRTNGDNDFQVNFLTLNILGTEKNLLRKSFHYMVAVTHCSAFYIYYRCAMAKLIMISTFFFSSLPPQYQKFDCETDSTTENDQSLKYIFSSHKCWNRKDVLALWTVENNKTQHSYYASRIEHQVVAIKMHLNIHPGEIRFPWDAKWILLGNRLSLS